MEIESLTSSRSKPGTSSSSRDYRGAEPEYTNYAHIRDKPFVGTLDYILISAHWSVTGVVEPPAFKQLSGPLPADDEPSDHVLISADLQLAHVDEGGR